MIPKSSNPKHIRENFEIWDFCLTSEEMGLISEMDKGRELFFEHDSPEFARMIGEYRMAR